MDWILNNKDWFLSGLGLAIIGWIGKIIFVKEKISSNHVHANQSVVVNNIPPLEALHELILPEKIMSLADRKSR